MDLEMGEVAPDASAGIRLLSLNCWGLKYVSKVREPRLRYIAEQIAQSSADVVALQECWVASDYAYLRSRTAAKFPYGKHFSSGMLAGSGLVILSRFRMTDAAMRPYMINGRPSAFFRGDWYVGKGVASAVLQHPSGAEIEVFNTHMHAPYGPGDASYVCHRTTQAWELARYIRTSVALGRVVLAVGDFNSRPGSLTYRLLTERGGLADSWDTHQAVRGGAKPPAGEPALHDAYVGSLTPEQQIAELGVTCDSQLNTWRASRERDEACRLDYCFHSPGTSAVVGHAVVFTETVPTLGVSPSDHFGVQVDLALTKEAARAPAPVDPGLYDGVLATIAEYRPTSDAQASWRLRHFFASLVAVAALLIGVFWIDHGWGGFIIALAAVLVAVTGVVDGLMGFLFGRFERRALDEVADEVAIVRG
ncbi:Endonuclease/exonuclease/phosphatase [Dipodascopsis tothii]|uniref:Endonuclease/exonuclease/phosphatase n=1 Tax=Dipodascopsis tothii TaxID=44089 RepID=UPI0034CEAB4B